MALSGTKSTRSTVGDSELPIIVRDARDEDVAALTALYAHHVLHGLATFEVEPPDEAEMRRRLHELTGQGFPWLVAEAPAGALDAVARTAVNVSNSSANDSLVILGYAYAGPYRARIAWRHTVEDSIYLRPDATGRGVGRKLLDRLIEASMARGYRQMVAVIGDSANTASIAVHAACGFQPVGVLRDVGVKFGRWVDSVLMQRALGEGASTVPTENA